MKVRYAVLACAVLFAACSPTPTPPPVPPDSTVDTTIVTPPPVDTSAAIRINLSGDSLTAIISIVSKTGTPISNVVATIGMAPKGQGQGSGLTSADGTVSLPLSGPGSYIACTVLPTLGTFCTPEKTFPFPTIN